MDDIDPLPNIEYNIMCGNSLVGYVTLDKIITGIEAYGIKNDLIAKLQKHKELIIQYKSIVNLEQLKTVKQEIEALKMELREILDKKYLIDDYQLNNKITGAISIPPEVHLINQLKPFHWGIGIHGNL